MTDSNRERIEEFERWLLFSNYSLGVQKFYSKAIRKFSEFIGSADIRGRIAALYARFSPSTTAHPVSIRATGLRCALFFAFSF